jgi:pimeloyl-ACP methyl ester carboxylesterase
MNTSRQSKTRFLQRPEGRIAYDDQGAGPLVVAVPGMGDLRSTYRFQIPALVEAGYRVVTVDLRGHGDSDTRFSSYDDEALASDLLALMDQLGPAVIIGNSMGSGAAVIAAAQRPDLVTGLVLIGPFVRNPALSKAKTLMFRIAMARPWARLVWRVYLPSLYAGHKPTDFGAYRALVLDAMGRPGYSAAFARTARTSHAPAEAALSGAKAPSLVVMGSSDPDFEEPVAEAQWIGDTIGSRVVIVDDAGHYPQSQLPDVVNPVIVGFLRELDLHA